MFQAKSLERRQQLVKMLSKVIETIGEEWTQSGKLGIPNCAMDPNLISDSASLQAHVENNRRQLEQFLDTPIKESDCFGKVVLPPLRQLQGDPDCQVPLAAFQLHFLRGSLMLPLYDPTRSEFLEWAKMIEEALPSLLLNLALNHETFEAWWTVGFAYTHLAWCILSQENGNVLRNYKDEIAQYQKVGVWRGLKGVWGSTNLSFCSVFPASFPCSLSGVSTIFGTKSRSSAYSPAFAFFVPAQDSHSFIGRLFSHRVFDREHFLETHGLFCFTSELYHGPEATWMGGKICASTAATLADQPYGTATVSTCTCR